MHIYNHKYTFRKIIRMYILKVLIASYIIIVHIYLQTLLIRPHTHTHTHTHKHIYIYIYIVYNKDIFL